MTTSGGALKKKQRVGSNNRLSAVDFDSSFPDGTLAECSHKSPSIRRSSSQTFIPIVPSCAGGFNDSSTADVILCLLLDHHRSHVELSEASSDVNAPINQSEIQIYLHSRVLCRSKYFSALLSDRWQQLNVPSSGNSENASKIHRFTLTSPANPDSISNRLTVLQLLYSDDLLSSIDTVSTALNLLPIALELLFEDCIKACVTFLEAVPWSEDEEDKIMNLVPFLNNEESQELLSRVSPAKCGSSEEMLHGLVLSAIHNHPNMAFAKAFVAKLLRDFTSRESARKVLDKAFEKSLKVVKQSLEEYSSPDFRGDHNETEAIQRLNLHTAMTNGKHLLWLLERMTELKVADAAVRVWSEQASFTADLQRALRDDAWRNISPSLPIVVIRCTVRLANAVASGDILANTQIRTKLVRHWLPVLIICRDTVSSSMGPHHKTIYHELEHTFLKIISTLPLPDAQDLLQQCLSFSTRNVDDCPHLVDAFTTWFRRANRPPQPEGSL
ncbi:hypothetical protein OROGR_031627 [Orobanche gracilis]